MCFENSFWDASLVTHYRLTSLYSVLAVLKLCVSQISMVASPNLCMCEKWICLCLFPYGPPDCPRVQERALHFPVPCEDLFLTAGGRLAGSFLCGSLPWLTTWLEWVCHDENFTVFLQKDLAHIQIGFVYLWLPRF